MARYIKLYEQILDWEWFHDTITFKVFIYLLLRANYCDSRFQGVDVKRGQLVTSLQKIATSNRISIRQARTAISHLKSTGEVTSQAYHDFSVITVVKYEDYQGATSQATSKRQASDKPSDKPATSQATTSKELIEDIELKNKENSPSESKRKAQPFIPPTVEEIAEYCRKRNNGIDPEYFFDYQEARNWTLKGGQKIKNWQAVIRTWERRDMNGLQQNGPGRNHEDDQRPEEQHRSKYAWLRDTVIHC